MRITVVCSEAEYAEIKAQAGLVPLSRWIKSKVLGLAGEVRHESAVDQSMLVAPSIYMDERSAGKPERPGRVMRVRSKDVPIKPKLCRHGLYEANCQRCKELR